MSTAALPGDVLLVSRKRTFRSFASGPLSWVPSWRIQRDSNSEWNHAAIFTTPTRVVEAKWGGVQSVAVSTYMDTRKYKLGLVRMPGRSGDYGDWAKEADRISAVEFARSQVGVGRYDRKTIIHLKLATMLFGHDGLERVVQPVDDLWICSEIVFESWKTGGVPSDNHVDYPGEFARLWKVRDLRTGKFS